MGSKLSGRKPEYTPDTGISICDRLCEGQSLRTICKDEDMPSIGTVMRWLAHPGAEFDIFRKQYEEARLAQAETLADEITAIADDESKNVQVQRLRVDARKWVASKLKPKKYGDKTAVDVNIGIEDRLKKLWEKKQSETQ